MHQWNKNQPYYDPAAIMLFQIRRRVKLVRAVEHRKAQQITWLHIPGKDYPLNKKVAPDIPFKSFSLSLCPLTLESSSWGK